MSKGFWIGMALVLAAVFLAAGKAFGATVGGSVSDSQKLDLLVRGIAFAEGGWDDSYPPNGRPGTRPFRNNNPGDLELAGDQGVDAGGYGVFSSADFPSAQAGGADPNSDGFAALYREANLILTGQARITPQGQNTTWAQVAQGYDTGGDALSAWLPNVASIAGMSPEQTISEWLNS